MQSKGEPMMPPRTVKTSAATAEPILVAKGVSKFFPGVVALDNVDFEIRPGEVNALLGENGAGKSTLIKIMSGFYAPDRGEILINGKH
jgi:ABC-type sugar transport system ATPase subunit